MHSSGLYAEMSNDNFRVMNMHVESLGCHFPRGEDFVSETRWEISADFLPFFCLACSFF